MPPQVYPTPNNSLRTVDYNANRPHVLSRNMTAELISGNRGKGTRACLLGAHWTRCPNRWQQPQLIPIQPRGGLGRLIDEMARLQNGQWGTHS
jgi:hypothetical protein